MCDTKEIEFLTDEGHMVKTWNIMYELMMHNKLCDVEVHVNGEKFHYHAIVLAACSDYLNTELIEKQQDIQMKQIKIHNNDIGSVDAVQRVFQFCYTGNIEIKKDAVNNILSVATNVGIEPVIQMCLGVLRNTINIDNCLGLFALTQLHFYGQFEIQVAEFIGVHFNEVTTSTNFLQLDAQVLRNLIKLDNMGIDSEMDVFNAVKRWIQYDSDNRKKNITSLMEFIRLPLMSLANLFGDVQTFCNENFKCQQLLLEAVQWQTVPSKRAVLNSIRTKPRSPLTTIMIAGGWNTVKNFTATKTIEIYNASTDKWSKYMDTGIFRNGCGVGLIGDEMIFAGGRSKDVESINLITGKKTTLPSLQTTRVFATVITRDDKFYLFGGVSEFSFTASERNTLNSVEIWNSKTKSWSYGTPMITGRFACGGAILGNEFFVVGGGADDTMDVTEAYCFITGKWRKCASMVSKRCYISAVAFNGYLYVAGGASTIDTSIQRLASVERYDPVTDKWTIISNINSERYFSGLGVLGNDIIAIGGANGSIPLNVVEVFDTRRNQWKTLKSTVYPREQMCVLNVPVSYLDIKHT